MVDGLSGPRIESSRVESMGRVCVKDDGADMCDDCCCCCCFCFGCFSCWLLALRLGENLDVLRTPTTNNKRHEECGRGGTAGARSYLLI